MLRSSAREYLDREWPLARVLELQEGETGFQPELWRQMAEMGWLGMAIPEAYGGEGSSLTDLGVLHEELGRSCMATPLHVSSVVCGRTIVEAGSDAQKQALLPAISRGDRIFTLAFTEQDYGWGPEAVQLGATPANGGYRLNGTKLFTPFANVADDLIVAARTGGAGEDGITLFHVPTGTDGVRIRQLKGFTGDRPCQVTLNNVQVQDSAVLGQVGGGWAPLQRALDGATAVLCTFMAGALRQAVDISINYSQGRIAFGVPIGTFQRVQDWIILALNNADATRWTAYEALWKLDVGKPDASQAVSVAKATASEGFVEGADAAHHVHGGIGVDMKYGLYAYMRQARTLYHYLGSPEFHRNRIAAALSV
jgi:alkylation response protein AidB-like acyl-CoA dehydrogenase